VRRAAACAILAVAVRVAAQDRIVDRIAAAVNDIAIPESEVRKAMVVSALTPEPGESPEAFRGRVLDALIDQHLEHDDAARFGPPPPNAAEIAEALEKLEERLRAEGRDPKAEYAKAGLTPDDVRASLERQLVVQKYLRERFAPMAYANDEQAREEYDQRLVPELHAAGQPVPAFEQVAEEMRRRYSARAFDEEVAKWLKDLRQKSRISIYRIPAVLPAGPEAVVVSREPTPAPTPGP
jgi:hypothetical protein